MFRLTAIRFLGAITGLSAMVQAQQHPDCTVNQQLCGWQLIKQQGWTEQELTNILFNVDEPADRTHIYDSLYICDASDIQDEGPYFFFAGWCQGSWNCVSKNDTSGNSECTGQAVGGL
ncbi:hypothetical protein N0V85_007088 [Neurospora sp. IMI 360204]|nr:hypothetical protein N0V85_007088 [Neurospora sp. IMI 360204]